MDHELQHIHYLGDAGLFQAEGILGEDVQAQANNLHHRQPSFRTDFYCITALTGKPSTRRPLFVKIVAPSIPNQYAS